MVLAAGLVCLFPGCVPGISWLPDSNGFAFTSSQGHLILYDIPTAKHRVILQDPAAAKTCWPAISPSGQRIALANLLDSDDKKSAHLQFLICDLQGKTEFLSGLLDLARLKGQDLEYTTQVVWSPDEKKLLVHAQGIANQGIGFNSAALFDLATRKLQVWDNHLPAYFGGTPVRPDGAGFLLGKLKTHDEVGDYVWVDWMGKEQRITVAPRKPEVLEPLPAYTALLDSRWEGTNAIITLPKQSLVIDTKKGELRTFPNRKPEMLNGKEVRMRTKLASGLELFLLEQRGEGREGPGTLVVARKPGESTVTEVLPAISDRMVWLNPAPNGKHAVVRVTYGIRGSKRDTIYLLSDNGKVVQTIDLAREFGKK